MPPQTSNPHPAGPGASDDPDALARRACAGDRDAFDVLAAQLRPRLVALLRQKLRRHADAEDTAQAALLRWWQKRDAYDPKRPFLPWLMTLALRLATDTQRAGARRLNHETAAGDEAARDRHHAPRPEHQLEHAERHRTVWTTVRDVLGPDAATALWLFYGEGFTAKEIAKAMDKKSGAVRVMLHRGRAALRPHLADLAPQPQANPVPNDDDKHHEPPGPLRVARPVGAES